MEEKEITMEEKEIAKKEKKATKKTPLSEGQHVQQDKSFEQMVLESEKVKMTIFPQFDGQDKLVVTINGVDFKVPVGVETEVPAPVAEVVRHHLEQHKAIKDAERANVNRSAGIL